MKLVTAAQMRDLEEQAVAAGVSMTRLMENAGLAVAQEAWLTLGVVAGRRVLVLCGPGNNGGDGLVAARHLADWEADVVVYLMAPRNASDSNYAELERRDLPVFVAGDDEGYARLQQALDGAELVIDALLGTGRSRKIDGALAEILSRLADAQRRPSPPEVISVDLPTGVDADSGTADDLAVRADQTVTFGCGKVGLYTLPGSEYAGRIQVVDIEIPRAAEAALPVELLSTAWVRERLPTRAKAGNKGTFGKVLVVAGSSQFPGAARLTAEACYRAGAGLVTVAAAPSLRATLATALPEATYIALEEEDLTQSRSLEQILERLPDFEVLLIGPGLTQADGIRDVVVHLLSMVPRHLPCVVDADALNALAKTPGWQANVAGDCVLTPHPGEMSRLASRPVEDVQADRLNLATEFAATWHHVVALKGAHTVVAAPEGRGAVSPHANALLAVAGTGDVLAGTIAGLLAQGMAPFEAAAAGVYVHGMAAEELSDELGDRGLLASDLLAQIPRTIRTIREGRRSPVLNNPFAGGLAGIGNLGEAPPA